MHPTSFRTTAFLIACNLIVLTNVTGRTTVLAVDAPATQTPTADDTESASQSGIERRVPWTTSRITGSPDPPSPYRVERVYSGISLEQPVEMTHMPGSSRPFVVERNGNIYRLAASQDGATKDLFFDGQKEIDGLTAVYGLAFHPEFNRNRECFVCYILQPGQLDGTRVSRFRVIDAEPPRIDTASEQILLTWKSGGHNGGSLKFGPDGYLYVSTGDASPPSPPDELDTGQHIDDLIGSILRIDVDQAEGDQPYAIPTSNPFVGIAGARGEVWAYGLRNPWRMSFDRRSGDLWLGDVGWQLWEMVYRIQRGGNYGWSIMEGPQPVRPGSYRGPTPILPPVVAHPRSEAASVTGGYVYCGNQLRELQGAYIYGDYVTGKIWALRYDGTQVNWHQELVDTSLAIIAFCESPDGELLLMDYNGGTIHRLIANPTAVNQSHQAFPNKLSETGLFSSIEDHVRAPGVVEFSINAPHWADHSTAERYVAVPGIGSIEFRRPTERVPTDWGSFPTDTVLVKTISLETQRGNPATRRRIETQVLHTRGDSWRGNSGEWYGYTYVWNDQQTDAELAPAEGIDLELFVADPRAAGSRLRQVWHVPSRSECYLCHNPWTGYRLAFTPEQLDKDHSYHGQRANQLQALRHIGVLAESTDGQDHIVPERRIALVNPDDSSAQLGARARSYLHVNCAHCHRFGGGGTATIDLQFATPFDEMNAIDVRPTQGTFNLQSARIIASGHAEHSILYYRMAKLGPGHMPYFGSQVIDHDGLQLIADWINQLPRPTKEVDPVNSEELRKGLDALALLENDTEATDQQIARLLASTSSALLLVQQIDNGRLTGRLKEMVLAKGTRHASPAVRDLYERFLPDDQRTKRLGNVIDPDKILAQSASVARGRDVFFTVTGIQCKNCHRIGGVGGDLGPDLNYVGKKLNRRQLLESIIEPSKTVDPKFATYLIETSDGRVLSGLVLERTTDFIVVKDAQNKMYRVASSDVDHLQPQPKSLMPEGLHRDMTAQQLADLLAYLCARVPSTH